MLVGAAVVLLHADTAAAQNPSEPLPPNPFAEFRSFRLGNGLKVWFRQLPGSGLVAATLAVPYGWDRDPVGREGTAHFLEHVLLSDRGGRTDAELRRELEARGGTFGGTTSAARTTYSVTIGRTQGDYGLRWLGEAVAPRVLTQDLVERTREPVAIEISARDRSPLEKLWRKYAFHPALRPPGFWKREFGLDVQQERLFERHDALHSISSGDLNEFYDTYYAAQQMTLMVVGDIAWTEIESAVQGTFGSMPWRPTPPPAQPAAPDSEHRARHAWWGGRNTLLQLHYRVPQLTERDQLRLIFLEDLMMSRLFERLRLGGQSLVYDVFAGTETRSDAGMFTISTLITPGAEENARAAIAAEMERLRTATTDTLFYADRDALTRRLRLQNSTATALQAWLSRRFYEPSRTNAFPDVGAYYATVGADSIAAFAQRLFAHDNTIVRLIRPPPVSTAVLVLLALITMAAAVLLYRRLTLQPADMSRIRYVGRLRPPTGFVIVRLLLLAVALIVCGRLLVAAGEFFTDALLLRSDSFVLHLAVALLALFAVTLGGFAIAGVWPRKLLLFEDELRVKSLTYRSWRVPLDRVTGSRRTTAAEARRAGKRLRGHSYTRAPGVLIELAGQDALLYHVRDANALQRALQNALASVHPSHRDDESAHRSE